MATSPKNKLDYFDARDQVHPLNTFYEGEENFDGILTDGRRYTDIFFLIVFLLLNGVLVYYSQTGETKNTFKKTFITLKFQSSDNQIGEGYILARILGRIFAATTNC